MERKKLRRSLCLLMASALAASMLATTGAAAFADGDGNMDLDLEAGTDTPSSTAVDQYYVRTTSDTTKTVNRIKVSWVEKNVEVKVASATKWNPTSLEWETDGTKNGKASVAEGTNVTTFTFTNYSTKAFGIVPTFAADENLPSGASTGATYDAEAYTVAAVEMKDDTVAADKYFTDNDNTKAVNESALPSVTITATNGVDASKFDGAKATTEKQRLGTFTFACTAQ